MTRLNPYINFNGKAKEAIEFYKTVFGGVLTMSTYKEGGMSHGPEDDNKIMHSMLEVDDSLTLMAADVPKGMEYKPGTNISISLSGNDDALLSGYFEKLSAGGTIQEPLVKAPWGDKFGMFIDKFGIRWMVNIAGKK